jgi:ATP-binding cassette subfamily F protein 3
MSDVIIRFDNVNFGFSEKKIILDEVNFSVREGSKITLMGQNGAGKSTIFEMLMGQIKPNEGNIHLNSGLKVAIARQVFERSQLPLSTRAYFESAFEGQEIPYNLDKRIKEAVEITNLENWSLDKLIGQYSGGQQARLLLAHALIQEPQILLLDEPTNNLDVEGIEYLTGFLMMYMETCIVISHDADFLNSFTDGVLYLDVNTHKVEQYSGDYYKVVDEIANRIERENKQNARMERQIEDQKAKINFFAHKGGKMRKLASKLRDDVAEENKVDVRKEDRTIRKFNIPCQEGLIGALVSLSEVGVINCGVLELKAVDIELRKKSHLQIKGSNGMGKTTLLNKLAEGEIKGLNPDVKIGYYTQDFSNLDFERTIFDELIIASGLEIGEFLLEAREQKIRGLAAGFLIDGKLINTKIGDLSEGQKGLVAFARLVLLEPGLIILDEPTNHINFRHIPVIAKALADFEGAMILVSHVSHFTDQIGIEQELDLAKLLKN